MRGHIGAKYICIMVVIAGDVCEITGIPLGGLLAESTAVLQLTAACNSMGSDILKGKARRHLLVVYGARHYRHALQPLALGSCRPLSSSQAGPEGIEWVCGCSKNPLAYKTIYIVHYSCACISKVRSVKRKSGKGRITRGVTDRTTQRWDDGEDGYTVFRGQIRTLVDEIDTQPEPTLDLSAPEPLAWP